MPINKMRAIHPGEVLQEELETLELSATAFAKALHIPPNRITLILHKQRAITADTAIRLAAYFGNTPEFWMNLQIAYDIKTAMKKFSYKIRHDIELHKAA